ncbi:hypothetical protein [Aureimonas sp. D3]|uniref:hypothetical protein n=1 Tax=Aureimonas sp. D3 TaxID=1638164 RepID=UPI00078122FD|nr:hypothetical protein [Aureimonas sp. D3]
MTGSPLVAALRERLAAAGYDDLPVPLRIAGVEFQFTGAMRGRHGRALDLVLLVDTTAGNFGDSDGPRVRHRLQAMSRALDVTASRYVLTVILAGAALPGEIELLTETARVLHVNSLPRREDGTMDMDRLEDGIRVLLPLSLPAQPSDANEDTAEVQLAKILPQAVDRDLLAAVVAAAESGDAAVAEAIAVRIATAIKEDKA